MQSPDCPRTVSTEEFIGSPTFFHCHPLFPYLNRTTSYLNIAEEISATVYHHYLDPKEGPTARCTFHLPRYPFHFGACEQLKEDERRHTEENCRTRYQKETRVL